MTILSLAREVAQKPITEFEVGDFLFAPSGRWERVERIVLPEESGAELVWEFGTRRHPDWTVPVSVTSPAQVWTDRAAGFAWQLSRTGEYGWVAADDTPPSVDRQVLVVADAGTTWIRVFIEQTWLGQGGWGASIHREQYELLSAERTGDGRWSLCDRPDGIHSETHVFPQRAVAVAEVVRRAQAYADRFGLAWGGVR